MSNDVAIRIEYLGKRYRYGGAAPLSANLRADLTDWARGLWPCRNRKPETGNLKSEPQVSGFKSPPSSLLPPPSSSPSASPQISGLNSHPSPNSPSPSQVSGLPSHHSSFREVHEKHIAEDPNYFWALRDINLEVRQGEVVGIIGRNGAGKSTLLKILSRITPPTTGKITYNGRIASLLEVGTGFHRELTGRENIFLNGSILGMKRAEIAKKFDEIVAFAEVEKFIDTPVKFYSSGMYVRLAFAVAAHLEPEILVVDEVLAVGDAQFQKKCLGKMGDVAKQGRTILFVSHNMAAVARLCKTAVWIHCGAIVVRANSDVVLNQYLNSAKSKGGEYRALSLETAPGNERLRLMRVTVKNSNGEPADSLEIEQPFHVEIEYEVLQSIPSVRVGFCLLSNDGTIVFTSGDTDPEGLGTARTVGRHVSTCTIPGSLLNVGRYFLSVSSDIPMQEILFTVENVVGFDIAMTGGVGGSIPDNRQGIVRLLLAWKTGVA